MRLEIALPKLRTPANFASAFAAIAARIGKASARAQRRMIASFSAVFAAWSSARRCSSGVSMGGSSGAFSSGVPPWTLAQMRKEQSTILLRGERAGSTALSTLAFWAAVSAGFPATVTSAWRSVCNVTCTTIVRRACSFLNWDSSAAMAGFTQATSESVSMATSAMFSSVKIWRETSTFSGFWARHVAESRKGRAIAIEYRL